MSIKRKLKKRKQRRSLRARKGLKSSDLPRVSVFRSIKQIYAQIIDSGKGETVVSASSLKLKEPSKDKKAIAHAVGLELANLAKEKGISKVIFDRGPYLFHGRVKALADGLREGGITI